MVLPVLYFNSINNLSITVMSELRKQANEHCDTKEEADAYFLAGNIVKAAVVSIVYNAEWVNGKVDANQILKQIEEL